MYRDRAHHEQSVVRRICHRPNKATEQLIEFVKATSNHPSFETDTQVVSGDLLLTVLPSLQAEKPVSFRIEFAAEGGLSEHPYPVIMLAALFDFDTVAELRRKIVDALETGQALQLHRDEWKLTLWRAHEKWMMEITAVQQAR